MPVGNQLRVAVVLISSIYLLIAAARPESWNFLDSVNLVIHEAGHTLFFPFGHFIMVLGGSLLQVAVPALFVWYFLRNRDLYSASFPALWTSQSIVNVSIYMADAIPMRLPLLGDGLHDWNYLFQTTGTLGFSGFIASLVYALGIAGIVTSGIVGARAASGDSRLSLWLQGTRKVQ